MLTLGNRTWTRGPWLGLVGVPPWGHCLPGWGGVEGCCSLHLVSGIKSVCVLLFWSSLRSLWNPNDLKSIVFLCLHAYSYRSCSGFLWFLDGSLRSKIPVCVEACCLYLRSEENVQNIGTFWYMQLLSIGGKNSHTLRFRVCTSQL
jgi:hypothetical protein